MAEQCGVGGNGAPTLDRLGCTTSGAQEITARHFGADAQHRCVGHLRDNAIDLVALVGMLLRETDEFVDEFGAKAVIALNLTLTGNATPRLAESFRGGAGGVDRNRWTTRGVGEFEQRNRRRWVVGRSCQTRAQHRLRALRWHDDPQRIVASGHDAIGQQQRITRAFAGNARVELTGGQLKQQNVFEPGHDDILARNAHSAANAVADQGAWPWR